MSHIPESTTPKLPIVAALATIMEPGGYYNQRPKRKLRVVLMSPEKVLRGTAMALSRLEGYRRMMRHI